MLLTQKLMLYLLLCRIQFLIGAMCGGWGQFVASHYSLTTSRRVFLLRSALRGALEDFPLNRCDAMLSLPYVVVNTVALICSVLSHVYLRFELGPIAKDAAGYDLGYSLGGKAAVQAFAKVIA